MHGARPSHRQWLPGASPALLHRTVRLLAGHCRRRRHHHLRQDNSRDHIGGAPGSVAALFRQVPFSCTPGPCLTFARPNRSCTDPRTGSRQAPRTFRAGDDRARHGIDRHAAHCGATRSPRLSGRSPGEARTELSERLEAGDLLVLNNLPLLHGREAFEPGEAGKRNPKRIWMWRRHAGQGTDPVALDLEEFGTNPGAGFA